MYTSINDANYVDANLDSPDNAISGNDAYMPKSNTGMSQNR